MAKVSFVAPVYNKAAWISRAIESMLEQSLTDIEVLFVNDGSTDGTADVIKYYMKQDKRVRMIGYRNNRGLGKAWNIGIWEARSSIICVSSGDDVHEKDRAKITYEYMTKHPEVDVFYGSYWYVGPNLELWQFKPAIPYNKEKLLTPRKDGFCPQYIGHITMAYRKKVGLMIPHQEKFKVGIDYPLLCDFAKKNCKFGWTKKIMAFAPLLSSGVSVRDRKEVDKTTQTTIKENI